MWRGRLLAGPVFFVVRWTFGAGFTSHFGSQSFFRNPITFLGESCSFPEDLGFATQDHSWCALIGELSKHG